MVEDFFTAGTLEAAWVAGLLAADGSVHKNLRRWELAQSGDDGRKIVESVASFVGHKNKIYVSRTTHKDSHSISVTSPQQVTDLQTAWGIGPRKSLVLEWPSPPSNLVSAFCRGYFEGDGSVGVYWTGTTDVLTVSIAGTRSFLSGLSNSAPSQSNQIRPIANIYEIRWVGERAADVMEWLYSDAGLPETRKITLYRNYMSSASPQWVVYPPLRSAVASLLSDGVSVPDAAREVGVAFQTVYRWKNKGLV